MCHVEHFIYWFTARKLSNASNISEEKSALSPMIAGATEHECLASAYHHSSLSVAHLMLTVICYLDFILLHLLGVSGHVNPFIAGDILL